MYLFAKQLYCQLSACMLNSSLNDVSHLLKYLIMLKPWSCAVAPLIIQVMWLYAFVHAIYTQIKRWNQVLERIPCNIILCKLHSHIHHIHASRERQWLCASVHVEISLKKFILLMVLCQLAINFVILIALVRNELTSYGKKNEKRKTKDDKQNMCKITVIVNLFAQFMTYIGNLLSCLAIKQTKPLECMRLFLISSIKKIIKLFDTFSTFVYTKCLTECKASLNVYNN